MTKLTDDIDAMVAQLNTSPPSIQNELDAGYLLLRCKSALEASERDAERLDFVLEQQAGIVTSPEREGRGKLYQLQTMDEDERFITLSGEGRFFGSTRGAIDAAISALAASEQEKRG